MTRVAARPARRAGRPQPGAEAAGRCPGSKAPATLRPDRPRDPEPRAGQSLSRPVRPRCLIAFLPRASACGLQPWAGLCRPVGPVGRTGILDLPG